MILKCNGPIKMFQEPTPGSSSSGLAFCQEANTSSAGLFGGNCYVSTSGFGTTFCQAASTSTASFTNDNCVALTSGVRANGTVREEDVTGTAKVRYVPNAGIDSVQKSGTSQNIIVTYYCITCMKEYDDKSLEELRLEDYVAGRKEAAGDTVDNKILLDLSGLKDKYAAMQYLERVTGLLSKDVYEAVRWCRGPRGWETYKQFLKYLQGTSNVTVIIQLLKAFTNEQDFFKAIEILEDTTGHGDIESIYNICQNISGFTNGQQIADFFTSIAHTSGVQGVRVQVNKLTGSLGHSEFTRVYKALRPERNWRETLDFLNLVTGCTDVGDAVLRFSRLVGKSTFAESVEFFKRITAQRELKHALLEIMYETKTVSLMEIVEGLKKLTEKTTFEEIHIFFEKSYQTDNLLIALSQLRNENKPEKDFLNALSELRNKHEKDKISRKMQLSWKNRPTSVIISEAVTEERMEISLNPEIIISEEPAPVSAPSTIDESQPSTSGVRKTIHQPASTSPSVPDECPPSASGLGASSLSED